MVVINGKELENIAGKTVLEHLGENGYDMKCIAVEINGGIVPKSQYEKTILHDGDRVEIVCFVGGG